MTAPLIALDARLTRQMSIGMKTYVRELVARLPRSAPDLRFQVFSNHIFDLDSPNVSLTQLSESEARNGALGEQFALPRRLRESHAGLIHYMSVYAPRRSPVRHVYTIHDLIHLRFPQYFSWKVPPYYRFVVGPVARAAARVITDASATVTDVHELLGVDRDRARVVPLGVSDRFVLDDDERARRATQARARFGLTRPYFLYAGNHRPHKNLETLVRSWRDLVEQPCDLVLTEEGPLDTGLQKSPSMHGTLHMTGHVELDSLISLYAGCTASVQPSLYEGFGLSVLEAMASGAPAVVAQTPALLEVGGDAVATFPATDTRALAHIMTALLGEATQADQMRAAGRERVRAFTWDATARATAQVYREALEL